MKLRLCSHVEKNVCSILFSILFTISAPNPVKDIKKQQNTAIKIRGLANVVEVACGSSFNLVSSNNICSIQPVYQVL